MMSGKSPSEQSERFKQAARELGVDLDEDKLKEALRKLGKPPQQREGQEDDDAG